MVFKLKILLTGANGYIGTRLLRVLAEEGHEVYALVRSSRRIKIPTHLENKVKVLEGDLLELDSLENIPDDIQIAYYLVHSMGNQASGFADFEARCAENFSKVVKKTNTKQIVYLSGLSHESSLSEHMDSRQKVEGVLRDSGVPLTTLRAGIVIGSGSASFEIIRDLVEKLPIMVAPRWVSSKCQPIAIRDVLYYLENVLLNEECLSKTFEIGGPDILNYKDMLLQLAKVRRLKRLIIPVPVLTPYFSSLWLFFITSTNFSIARALVNSLKMDAICHEQRIQNILPYNCLSYKEAVQRAFDKIEQNAVLSSWKDAIINSDLPANLKEYVEVPKIACFKEIYKKTYEKPIEQILSRLWSIGGDRGWYYMNWAWTIRGWVDQLFGGVGIRRGRTHPSRLSDGDALDFWRVLLADKEAGYLLLYAEMLLPGEAWIEWKIVEEGKKTKVTQTATFRPRGVLGRLYWYCLIPAHMFIFRGLCNSLAKEE
ncbi:Uncharacterized protein YbjT [Chlamydiales bacterium SCGC AB-751-O23]|jgi:uncharacterized protein YbjT (DUF2867 family)|nr:Uncharacterized protein YbjT [Chlamydiales bacterium SCGC AB-751-O23]